MKDVNYNIGMNITVQPASSFMEISESMTEQDSEPNATILLMHQPNAIQPYLISFFETGMLYEEIVMATDEDHARDVFRATYEQKTPCLHIACCELLSEAEKNRKNPNYYRCLQDGFEKYSNFKNAYYEKLNN